jgi:hypothetical protein
VPSGAWLFFVLRPSRHFSLFLSFDLAQF